MEKIDCKAMSLTTVGKCHLPLPSFLPFSGQCRLPLITENQPLAQSGSGQPRLPFYRYIPYPQSLLRALAGSPWEG